LNSSRRVFFSFLSHGHSTHLKHKHLFLGITCTSIIWTHTSGVCLILVLPNTLSLLPFLFFLASHIWHCSLNLIPPSLSYFSSPLVCSNLPIFQPHQKTKYDCSSANTYQLTNPLCYVPRLPGMLLVIRRLTSSLHQVYHQLSRKLQNCTSVVCISHIPDMERYDGLVEVIRKASILSPPQYGVHYGSPPFRK